MNGNTNIPWGSDKKVRDIQTHIKVQGNKITGQLNYVEGGLSPAGPLAGDGFFIALAISDIDAHATSCKVGLDPSVDTGLVEIIDDPDKWVVCKLLNKSQDFEVVSSDGTHSLTQSFDLSGLKWFVPDDEDPQDFDDDDDDPQDGD